MRTATQTTDDRRPTMAGAARMFTRECKRHHHTTTTASRRGGALHHDTIDDPRRYERKQVPNTRNDSIDRTYSWREEAPLQPAASMRSSRERPPHLTSAASATRHATKIVTPAGEMSDEGKRRVISVLPLASNTARVTLLRGGLRARHHNKRHESVSTRNPKHHHTAREHRLCRTATAPRTNCRVMCLGTGRGCRGGIVPLRQS